MANKKSAKKRAIQAIVRRERNRTRRSTMRSAIRKLRSAVAEGNAQVAKELLPETISIVNVTAQKGVIHRNAAARTTARLTRAVNALG